ncbi:Ig-like domain-containing protein [Mycolicibacterium stellerae]|uniref:Ig-like domain-containing protein n=1 Tax=Mycolicibacterium stellerae TaxID=2358193 RepID=UPI0013DE1373|nr:Ig-like domain-containing protein [Mycolicibacterium stellerae]
MVDKENRNARQSHATYIGRIGALAAALGVGVAIATGQGIGVAHAEDTDPTTNTTTDAGSDPDTDTGLDESVDPPTTQPDDGSDNSAPAVASGPATVPQMRFRSSGGALLSDRWQRRDTPRWRTVAESQDDKPDRTATDLSQSEAKRSTSPSEGATNQPHSTRVRVPVRTFAPTFNEPRYTGTTTAPVFHANDHGRQEHSRPTDPTADLRRVAIHRDDPDVIQTSAPGTQFTDQAQAVPRSATVLDRATTVLTAALSPFLTPRPAAPARPPVLLAVLGWIRREIEHTYFNRTPVANDVAVTVQSRTPTTLDVISVVDDDDVTYSVPERGQPGGPQSGTVVIDAVTGEFTYTPDAGTQVGTQDEFTVTVSDATAGFHVHGLSGFLHPDRGHTTTVTVSVTVVNTAPTAGDATLDATVDEAVDIDLSEFVSDPDGDPLTILSITVNATPDQGSYTIDYVPGQPDPGDIVVRTTNGDLYVPDGTNLAVFTYTPHNRGVDTITYVVTDGTVERTGTITIDAGAATDVTYDLEAGQSVNVDLYRLVTLPDGVTPTLTAVRFTDGENTIELFPPIELTAVGTDHATYVYPTISDQAVFTVTAASGGVDTITYTVQQGDSQITGTITVKVVGSAILT